MTAEIVMTTIILLMAVILFVTERLRVDLVALLVMVSLTVTGLVTPAEALSGFSNPAVVTVWAVFILSAGLSATGVANVIGQQVLRLSGKGEVRLLVVIMVTAAVLSGFMNNVGVVALLLPVVLTIARQTNIAPSKLLMPLAIGCLLGGLTTLIGTPPNILASDALREYGLEPFQLFDFAPVGIVIVLAGIAFTVTIGRRLLPDSHLLQAVREQNHNHVDPKDFYGLEERLAYVTLPPDSQLAGKTLTESRIGRALGLTILGVQRHGSAQWAVQPEMVLESNDRLLAVGRLDRLEDLSRGPFVQVEEGASVAKRLSSAKTGLAEYTVVPESPLVGNTVAGLDMRQKYQITVLAVRRGEVTYRSDLQYIRLEAGDKLLLQGDRQALEAANQTDLFAGDLLIFEAEPELAASYQVDERLLIISVPSGSPLAGQSLAESDLGDLFGLAVLGIKRGESTELAPPAQTVLEAGDLLLVEGKTADLAVIRGLQGLEIDRQPTPDEVNLESDMAGLVEVVLSPHATIVNKTLREINFREKYGLSVLAIWRDGRAYRSDLGNIPLKFGDAFLMFGPREKIKLLSQDPDYLVLTEEIAEAPRREKAPIAVVIMLAVVLAVLFGWLPIAIAAVAGAAFMVISGALSMDEAYRQIEWRAVFLIAGMLPLGIAMEQSGTAQFMADVVVDLVGERGPQALITGLFVLTSVASQVMPNPVVTVLMAPIAINTSAELGMSPQSLMMVIAIAASASFMSPVGHPANVLVMGPGGYRFADYIKIGLPLTLVVLLVVLLVLPIFWPLYP